MTFETKFNMGDMVYCLWQKAPKGGICRWVVVKASIASVHIEHDERGFPPRIAYEAVAVDESNDNIYGFYEEQAFLNEHEAETECERKNKELDTM